MLTCHLFFKQQREFDGRDVTWLGKSGLSPGNLEALVFLLGGDFSDCMLVPVRRPDNHQLAVVVGLFDKQGAPFSQLDLQAINQCFQ